MQLPNWAKILWWVALVSTLTYFLQARLPDLLSGKAAAADIAVFGVWMALLLAPLFTEVSLLGVTLKNEIDELKGHIATQLNEVRAEVRNAVDVRTTFNPVFQFPSPAADAQLPAIEAQVKAALSAALAEQGASDRVRPSPADVPEDVSFLFNTRYHMERELRRIAVNRRVGSDSRRNQPAYMLARSLVGWGLLSPKLGDAIREVYAVCSAAIHGEDVTSAQVNFVRDVGAELVTALRAIE